MSEFCSGVAVSSSFGVLDSAVRIADAIFAPGLVDVAESVCLIEDRQVPRKRGEFVGSSRGELVRAHDHRGLFRRQIKRIRVTCTDGER